MPEPRPPWSPRRRRLLAGLALTAVGAALAAVALPAQYGLSAAFLAALCAFLLLVALVVFVAVPGPGTLHALLHHPPLAGAVLAGSALLALAGPAGSLRWLWTAAAAGAAAWVGWALWQARRSG